MLNIAVIGSSGTIGKVFIKTLNVIFPNAEINAFGRVVEKNTLNNVKLHQINYNDETSIANAAEISALTGPLDLVIVATGVLHDGQVKPEKSIQDISFFKFQYLFAANTIFPALIAKYFLPKLARDRQSVFAALSARIGSISDNSLGGWYSYRASKAALNMVIKNLAIEMKVRNKQAIIVGLHPGTVDSKLSQPFQTSVPKGKLFTPEYAVDKMICVLNGLTLKDSGKCFAWDGSEILP
ncbi:MAG: SDR family NAD(P)-dependent oxidoreductase [Neisseriaceae bacterium]